ncbi:MAG: hypothetical protein ACQESG_05300 [Nanobdellota archaeon]
MGFYCSPEGRAELAQESKTAYSLQEEVTPHGYNPGGIYVANKLERLGKKYSFWTQDFGHSKENMDVAIELGLLSPEMIEEAKEEERRSKEELKKIPFEYDYLRDWEHIGYDSTGKLVVSRKNIYSQTNKFPRIVDVADRYQNG